MSDLTLEQRDSFCKAILNDYSISDDMKSDLKNAILKYANSNLSEYSLEKMLNENTSIYSHINAIKTNINNFSGYFYEILCVYEYNMYRNKEHITTILNPDTTSKTDILHVIETDKGKKIVPGGDVKSGSARYVLDQYEKLLKNKYDVPFIDYSGYLTTNKESLSPKQKERLENLLRAYPNKKPIPSILTNLNINKIKHDILAYFETGFLPSERDYFLGEDFQLRNFNENLEAREELIALGLSRKEETEPIQWEDLRDEIAYAIKDSKNWAPYYDEINELKYKLKEEENRKKKDLLEEENRKQKNLFLSELEKIEQERRVFDPYHATSEKNAGKKLLKSSKNRLKKTSSYLEYREKVKFFKRLIDFVDNNKENSFISIEYAYTVLEERKKRKKEYWQQKGMEFIDDLAYSANEALQNRNNHDNNEDDYAEDYYEDNYNDGYYEKGFFEEDLSREDEEYLGRESPSRHNVRGHTRTLKNGNVIPVRAHERGKKNDNM